MNGDLVRKTIWWIGAIIAAVMLQWTIVLVLVARQNAVVGVGAPSISDWLSMLATGGTALGGTVTAVVAWAIKFMKDNKGTIDQILPVTPVPTPSPVEPRSLDLLLAINTIWNSNLVPEFSAMKDSVLKWGVPLDLKIEATFSNGETKVLDWTTAKK